MWPQHPSYHTNHLNYFQIFMRYTSKIVRHLKPAERLTKLLLRAAESVGLGEKFVEYFPKQMKQFKKPPGFFSRLTGCTGDFLECSWDWYNLFFLVVFLTWICFVVYQGLNYGRTHRAEILRKIRVYRMLTPPRRRS